MFHVTNIREIYQISEIRTHYTAETSPTLREGSCNRNTKKKIPDVTFNSFLSDCRKMARVKVGLLNYR